MTILATPNFGHVLRLLGAQAVIDNPCVVMRPNLGARDVEADDDQTGLSFAY